MSEWATHAIDLAPDVVTKRFLSWDRGEHLREWRALTLLDQHASDLGPAPVSADLEADPPVIVMSRVPGEPLRGTGRPPVDAVAEALMRMHTQVPADQPAAAWRAETAIARVQEFYRAGHQRRAEGVMAEALTMGAEWLRRTPLAEGDTTGATPVFGQVDGNLANFLWDGSRVRIVDFEDSGRTDRPFDLATVVEHLSAWVDTDFDAAAFLAACDLSPAEERRSLECRRVLALAWVMVFASSDRANARNPPGTGDRQARRLLDLLGQEA